VTKRFQPLAIALAFALALALSGCAATAPAPDRQPRSSFRVIGYASTRTNFQTINPRHLTHINYAFAKVRGDDLVVFENADAAEDLAKLRALKAGNPALKVILSIGGWGAEWFSDAALTAESRCRFASSAVALMRQHGLDGLDIDWEYPGQAGAGNRNRPEDKQNFTLLLEELRRELDRSGGGTLSIASSGGRYFRYTEMDKLHAHLDWINVMAYDMAGGWSRGTEHHAPLHGEDSAEAYIRQHLAAGIPASKIVVGVPFYGRMWKWVVNRQSPTGLGEPFDWFVPDVPWSALERDYLGTFERKWDEAAKAPFLWDAASGTFISYEDPRSLAEKARFVKQQGLGGIMFWEHRHDPSETLLAAVASVLLPRPAEPRRTRGGRESRDRTASAPDSPDSRDARPDSGSRR
jgi:chitinase